MVGYRFLAQNLLFRAFPEYWLSNRFSLRVHENGFAVSCAVMRRVAKFPVSGVIVLVEYPAHLIIAGERPDAVKRLFDCLDRSKIRIVDTFDWQRGVFDRDNGDFARIYVRQMSAAGNRAVAQLLSPAVASLLQGYAGPARPSPLGPPGGR